MPTPSSVSTEGLVKKTLADRLHAQIMKGALPPGARIIEGKWAQQFGVAQGTIREAINILERDGFVTKESGRSARVVNLTEKDDFSHLQSKVDGMRKAAKAKNAGGMLDCDLQFHLELCRLSGNKHLFDYAQRMLTPFFAFVRLRLTAGGRGTSVWDKDLESHQRIVDLLRDGEGDVAEQYVKKAMLRFAKTAYDNWVAHEKSLRAK